MNLQAIRQLVARDFDEVNQAIIHACHSEVPLITEISHHLIDSGGKRLRPMLTLLCGRALTTEPTEELALFATIIEFIHAATLLHDDVVDESLLRRGQNTANQQWGNQTAVLVGDFLYSRAFQMMARLHNMPIMNLMADTTNKIATGEVQQLIDCHDSNLTEQNYLTVIEAKTAVLFSAACRGAAILCSTDESTQHRLAEFGLNLGLAYQLIDDILDYTGDTTTLGKTTGDDFAEGKWTLPLIYALKQASQSDKARLLAAIHQPQLADFSEIQALIDSTQSIEYTYQLANSYCQRAQHQLQLLPASEYRTALADCLTFITARRY